MPVPTTRVTARKQRIASYIVARVNPTVHGPTGSTPGTYVAKAARWVASKVISYVYGALVVVGECERPMALRAPSVIRSALTAGGRQMAEYRSMQVFTATPTAVGA